MSGFCFVLFCFTHYSYQQKTKRTPVKFFFSHVYVWHNIHLNQWVIHQRQPIVIFLPSVLPSHMTTRCLKCGCYEACCWVPITVVFIHTSWRENIIWRSNGFIKGCPEKSKEEEIIPSPLFFYLKISTQLQNTLRLCSVLILFVLNKTHSCLFTFVFY